MQDIIYPSKHTFTRLAVFAAMNLMNDLNIKDKACNGNDSNNSCDDYSTRIWFGGAILGSGVLILFGWLLLCLVYLVKYLIWDTIVTQIRSENKSLQTKITDKVQEIANLQRQLNNGRNDRRPARVDNALPLYREQENEREALLTRRSPDYQAV